MRLLVPILMFSLLFAACNKDNDEELPADFNGMYSGTFSRTGMDTANVTITFYETIFQGQSDRAKYPAICHGSFGMSQNTISFVDSCSWTADFDWSLILNGTYNLSLQSNNSMRIWRMNGAMTDEYILKKVVR